MTGLSRSADVYLKFIACLSFDPCSSPWLSSRKPKTSFKLTNHDVENNTIDESSMPSSFIVIEIASGIVTWVSLKVIGDTDTRIVGSFGIDRQVSRIS